MSSAIMLTKHVLDRYRQRVPVEQDCNLPRRIKRQVAESVEAPRSIRRKLRIPQSIFQGPDQCRAFLYHADTRLVFVVDLSGIGMVVLTVYRVPSKAQSKRYNGAYYKFEPQS